MHMLLRLLLALVAAAALAAAAVDVAPSCEADPSLLEQITTEVLAGQEVIWPESVPAHLHAKALKHIPTIEVYPESGRLKASLAHGQDDEHLISTMWAQDERGHFLAAAQLNLEDPVLEFHVNMDDVKEVTVFASCNQHGVWAAKVEI